MIACSGCRATLPDWAQKCQFCGSDVSKVVRPVVAGAKPKTLGTTASWVWPAYYVLSIYWILSGLGGAFETYHEAITPVTMKVFGQSMTYTPGFGFWQIVGLVIAGLTVAVGIGLAARIEFVRGVTNFLACLKILRGVFGIVGSLLSTLMVGPLGLLFTLIWLLDIVAGAMTIYLIGETEKSAPSF